MVKVDFNKQLIKVVKNLQSKVDYQTEEALKRVIEYSTREAQSNYNHFIREVPADDPYVWVKHDPITKSSDTRWTSKIECVGNQVLFIEFGAGEYYYTEAETRFYQNLVGNPRPSSIYRIGGYINPNKLAYLSETQKTLYTSRGADPLWFYKSKTGRESQNAHLVKYNSSGEPIMITHGNRPSRSLYRAVGMALRRLAGGKLK